MLLNCVNSAGFNIMSKCEVLAVILMICAASDVAVAELEQRVVVSEEHMRTETPIPAGTLSPANILSTSTQPVQRI